MKHDALEVEHRRNQKLTAFDIECLRRRLDGVLEESRYTNTDPFSDVAYLKDMEARMRDRAFTPKARKKVAAIANSLQKLADRAQHWADILRDPADEVVEGVEGLEDTYANPPYQSWRQAYPRTTR